MMNLSPLDHFPIKLTKEVWKNANSCTNSCSVNRIDQPTTLKFHGVHQSTPWNLRVHQSTPWNLTEHQQLWSLSESLNVDLTVSDSIITGRQAIQLPLSPPERGMPFQVITVAFIQLWHQIISQWPEGAGAYPIMTNLYPGMCRFGLHVKSW